VQKESLQPLADEMFAAATGAFSTLAGISASAGAGTLDESESSIRIEPEIVATLTRVPSNGVVFVTRFVKADIGHVVEMMLGTPGNGGEMDAMQLSIVAETVAQIATAMGESLASTTGAATAGVTSEVISDAAGFPAPPFTTISAPITVGDGLATSIALFFDGLALSKIDLPEVAAPAAAPAPAPPAPPAFDEPPAAAAPPLAASSFGEETFGDTAFDDASFSEPIPAPAPPPPPPPPPPKAPPARQRPQPEGQAAQFTPMTPTAIRPAAPGQSNLDLVHDVPLEISAVLGQTELSLREVVAMQPGSVFELDKLSTEPIDLYVNNILIARGEVVIVDDKFAVKISELNPVVDRV
jgi:flagellar motor switch protein FliN